MNRIISHIARNCLLLSLITLIAGCEINQKEVLPEDGFTKIYNHPDELLSFYPESLIELEGGGYLMLSALKDEASEIEYPLSYLVKTNAQGDVEWSNTVDWLAPAAQLFRSGNEVGFVGMNQQFNAYVILVDPSSGDISGTHPLEMTMPLATMQDQRGNLIVLGYDFLTRSSWISRFSPDFVLQRSVQLSVNTDLEYLIQRHLNKTGQDFPFFIKEYQTPGGSGYCVNCFYNYTLRGVFMDESSLGTTGDIYSFQLEEGVSSLIHKTDSQFGVTSYYEGNNYLLPDVNIDISVSQNIKDLPGTPVYELTFKAAVRSGIISGEGSGYALFVSQTNNSSVVLYQVEVASDSLVMTHYHSFDEHVEVADFVQTEDGGVAILAGIHILGKYRRPLLIKMRDDQFIPEE
jgi:hypothetical protein